MWCADDHEDRRRSVEASFRSLQQTSLAHSASHHSPQLSGSWHGGGGSMRRALGSVRKASSRGTAPPRASIGQRPSLASQPETIAEHEEKLDGSIHAVGAQPVPVQPLARSAPSADSASASRSWQPGNASGRSNSSFRVGSGSFRGAKSVDALGRRQKGVRRSLSHMVSRVRASLGGSDGEKQQELQVRCQPSLDMMEPLQPAQAELTGKHGLARASVTLFGLRPDDIADVCRLSYVAHGSCTLAGLVIILLLCRCSAVCGAASCLRRSATRCQRSVDQAKGSRRKQPRNNPCHLAGYFIGLSCDCNIIDSVAPSGLSCRAGF